MWCYDVVQGTSTGDLERGPGHYASTSLPGEGRTVAIAGHRTTYLAPFRNLNELHHGDRIVLQMPYGRFTYVVQRQRIVTPNAWWITRNVGYERLVLSACNPLYSASQRIAVFARLLRVRTRMVRRIPIHQSLDRWLIWGPRYKARHVLSADHNARMTTDAESKLMTLKERLEQGQYNVDATKVADAILRNPLWIMLFGGASKQPGAHSQAQADEQAGEVAEIGSRPPLGT